MSALGLSLKTLPFEHLYEFGCKYKGQDMEDTLATFELSDRFGTPSI